MKKILILLTLSTLLTGCLSFKEQLYERDTKQYLNRSRQFNAEYLSTHQRITSSSIDMETIPYTDDTEDIMRCPEYVLNNMKADCDGYAYLSTIVEKQEKFIRFIIIQGNGWGHVVAEYTNGVIYSNHRRFKNGEYNINIQFADAEYIAYADINLKFMGGMLCSN